MVGPATSIVPAQSSGTKAQLVLLQLSNNGNGYVICKRGVQELFRGLNIKASFGTSGAMVSVGYAYIDMPCFGIYIMSFLPSVPSPNDLTKSCNVSCNMYAPCSMTLTDGLSTPMVILTIHNRSIRIIITTCTLSNGYSKAR